VLFRNGGKLGREARFRRQKRLELGFSTSEVVTAFHPKEFDKPPDPT